MKRLVAAIGGVALLAAIVSVFAGICGNRRSSLTVVRVVGTLDPALSKRINALHVRLDENGEMFDVLSHHFSTDDFAAAIMASDEDERVIVIHFFDENQTPVAAIIPALERIDSLRGNRRVTVFVCPKGLRLPTK